MPETDRLNKYWNLYSSFQWKNLCLMCACILSVDRRYVQSECESNDCTIDAAGIVLKTKRWKQLQKEAASFSSVLLISSFMKMCILLNSVSKRIFRSTSLEHVETYNSKADALRNQSPMLETVILDIFETTLLLCDGQVPWFVAMLTHGTARYDKTFGTIFLSKTEICLKLSVLLFAGGPTHLLLKPTTWFFHNHNRYSKVIYNWGHQSVNSLQPSGRYLWSKLS